MIEKAITNILYCSVDLLSRLKKSSISNFLLYLVAISMFMILNRIKKNQLGIMSQILLFSNTFFIRKYEFNVVEINFTDYLSDYRLKSVFNHFLSVGWFPVLPWMGVFFLGCFFLNLYD